MTGTVDYANYTNVDAWFRRPYQPGDRLVLGHRGRLAVDDVTDLDTIAEAIFERHNRDDRPDGQRCPAMSIGDVVVIGETAVSVDRAGFQVVHPDPADLITDRSWRTVGAEANPTIGFDL